MKNDDKNTPGHSSLSSRQRVLAVLERRTPPVLASVFKATEEVDRQLMNHFGVTDAAGLIDVLGVCCLHWPWRHVQPKGLHAVRREGELEFDVWGVGRKKVEYKQGSYMEIAYSPLAEAKTAADVDNYDWPDVEQLDFSGMVRQCEKYAHYALSVSQWTIFEHAWAMRGFENFLLDLALNEKLAGAVISHIEQFNWQVITRTLEVAGGHIQLFGSGDDFGSQDSLLMSVETWQKYFAPGYSRAYELAHGRGLKTWMHCDGAVRPLIPKFIDIGLDVLDPLMPMIEEMNPYKIIPEFGKDLCFHGTIDTQHLLPFGTEEDVRSEVKRQMDSFWPRGGLFMGPSHCIQPGTPLKNILAVYDELNRAAC